MAMAASSKLVLKPRAGPQPRTTSQLPHSQLDQHGPDSVIQKLHEFCFALPDVNNEHSGVSVPGARALVIDRRVQNCCQDAFMVGREFAHIHPHPDNGSMHVQLPANDAIYAIKQGWGEDHYLVTQGHWAKGLIMVFSPRSDEELEEVKKIVEAAYNFATGRK